jgi:outer membrane immunogenic protein
MIRAASVLLGVALSVVFAADAPAADLPIKTPAYVASPAAAADGWTGFYAGINAGYGGWKDPTVTYTPNDINAFLSTCGNQNGQGTCVPSASFKMSGAIAGGQIGYNWRLNANWMLGIETDLDWSGIDGQSGPSNFVLNSVGPAFFVATEKVNWFGTLRGRIGVVPVSPLLVYATGGLAYGGVKESAFLPTLGTGLGGGNANGGFAYTCGPVTAQPNCFSGSSTQTLFGWTLGAGGEYALTSNVTLKAEYLYINLGHSGVNSVATSTFGSPGATPSSFNASFGDLSFSVLRGGVNLRF